MATKGSGTKNKNNKYEYQADIYNKNAFSENHYWEAIANKEGETLELRDFDTRALSPELYQ